MTKIDPKSAHRASIHHRDQIISSEMCGCFSCVSMFTPDWIEEWTDDGQTAICPHCGADAVIGDASRLPVANKVFLEALRDYWFSRSNGDD